MKRGVIYARYSCDNQREESIDGQIRDCSTFANSNDIEIISTYIDRAISARSDNRPEFQRMINDSYNNLFDVVLVWKSDRFSRNRRQALDYREILSRNKVKLLSCTEPNIDGPEQILYQGISDSYNEYYSVELARKIKRGEKENVIQGKANGGVVPYGYKLVDRKYIVIEEEAEVLRFMFNEYLKDNMTIPKLLDIIHARGIRNHKGNKFPNGSFYHLLQNRKYIGEYKFGDNINKTCIPAIIDIDTFNKVQEKLTRNKSKGSYFKKEEYLLSSKLRCAECGALLIGETGTSKTGRVYRYYKCQNAKKKHKECYLNPIKKDLIEDFVINEVTTNLKEFVDSKILASNIYNMQKKDNPNIKELEKGIAKVESKMNNIMNAIENGFDPVTFKSRYDDLKNEKEELTDKLYKERVNHPLIDKFLIDNVISKVFYSIPLTDNDKQFLVDNFISNVYLHEDGKVDIAYTFINSYEKILIEDIDKMSSFPLYLGPPEASDMVYSITQAKSYPIKSIKDKGARISLSSDYPTDMTAFLPLPNFEVAITRQPLGDRNAPISEVEERLSLEEVIEAYTINNAYEMRLEDKIGSIEVGKYADLTIFEENLFEIDPYTIHNVKIHETIMDGVTRYKNK